MTEAGSDSKLGFNAVLLSTFTTVFLAELGDKTQLATHHPSPRTPGTNGWFADGWTGFVAGKSSLAVTDRDPITLNCYGLHPSHFHVCDRVLGRAR